MNRETIKRLLDKYMKGESSLEENKYLANNADKLPPAVQTWFNFIRQHKTAAPTGMKDNIWQLIQEKRCRSRRLKIGMLSAAASILLLATIFVVNPHRNELTYQEKAQLLKEAKQMCQPPVQQETQAIPLYEDNLIIIYTTTK